MKPKDRKLTIRFGATDDQTYHLDLEGPDVGQRRGTFAPPYDPATWQAIMRALDPTFALEETDEATRAALQDLGDPDALPETAGAALARALLADEEIQAGFDVALGIAEKSRQALPVELRFGEGCDALAALPWELLHYKGRFLLADTSIALSRYPEGVIPPTEALGELPLRVLLVLSEPVDAPPIFSQRAREELLHGLRTLDEVGAVIVDPLRPPTFETLVEAVVGGGYHLLVFYGHGIYDEASGGRLLFEDEFGGPALVQADELGAALRNTDVRLVLLGACRSAQVGTGDPANPDVWSGTAPALLRAGVPLAIGMQVSMRVDAALAFIRQFALSLAAGKPVIDAVGEARLPLIRETYGPAWFIPALYGRPSGNYRLFDPEAPLPERAEDLRAEMKALRAEIAALEQEAGRVGVLTQAGEIARLREAKASFARARAELARRTPGGYAAVTSPLYGVPSNPVFVGRAEELREVSGELKGEQPVVIWGAGGIGKTALAVEVAHRQGWRFPAGVLWLDCRGGPALDSLLDRTGAFCGIAEMERVEPDKKEATVRGALAGLGERCLLVWDNAEDVWGNRAVRRFVENLPLNCQTLITTRDDPERAMWPTIELYPLVDEAMEELFYLLAAAARVKVGTQEDLDAIPHIVGWLQGHPLALMLVVPLAKRRGLQRTLADLQKRPLKGIEAAFEASYERLSDAQRRLFARLSVFTIPFEWEAAEAMLPGDTGVDEMLDVLVQRALVAFDGARYAYHALLRQYAYEKLRETEDPRPVHGLAAEYLQAKIADEERGGTPDEVLEEVDQWEKAEEWEQFALRALALVGSLDRVGYWGEIRERLERAREAVKEHLGSPPELEVGLLSDVATIAHKSADWDEAIALWEKAAGLYRAAGEEKGEAATFGNLGEAYRLKGEWERAVEFYQKALEIDERTENIHGMAVTYMNLGSVYLQEGELEWAAELYRKLLEINERVEDTHGVAQALGNLGLVCAGKGEWERAIEFYQESLAITENLGDWVTSANQYGNLGLVYQQKGEWNRAVEFYQKALEIKERVGDIHSMAQVYNNLGNVYAAKEEWERAGEFYRESLAIREQLGDIPGQAETWTNIGVLYLQTGRAEEAKPLLARAYLVFAQIGSPNADNAARALVQACGSVEAANAYLEQFSINNGR